MKRFSPQFSLRLPSGIRLERNLKEQEAEAIASDTSDMNTGCVWYALPEEEINDTKVIFSLCYYQGCLESVRIDLVDEKYGHGWSDWSEEKEMKRSKDTGRFLSKLGYPPGIYEWGEVWALFDRKGGFGVGGVRYTDGKHNQAVVSTPLRAPRSTP